MAFDDRTRNRLQRFVSDARALLSEEFTRQMQHEYGMDPSSGEVADLEKLSHLDNTRRETARLLRDTLAHYLATTPSGGKQEALQRILREQAFTVLNRLAALRMMEARGFLIESIARGYQSKGYQLYQHLAWAALGETGDAYRCYLFSLFDEFAMDLAVLFDRFSPQGRLFPREPALLGLLELINHPEIESLWAEDETIGWLYQYFNSQEERRQMRADSPAPRNSRELAVRNQFFTPRYVVEFLTDNTLGRLWYEMTQGQTVLTEQCRYLVRRPNEIFLQPGEEAPTQEEAQEELNQEELLKQPVYIPFRVLKDPRDITMLDPACGSMHFGLYAFDLFEVIYDEAWEIAHGSDDALKSCASFASFIAFVGQYPDKAAFLTEVPRLIIEHNLHGIDIDPRATQIAGLSLWLRAQRTWRQQGLRPQDRPRIRRSNIVCAEPMPGEEAFLEEFMEAHLSATPEHKLLGQLLRRVFDAMKLAGEAGSLLKIEEEIAGAVAEAKQKWLAGPTPEQGRLFADDTAPPSQKELGLDVTGITDETFWERAEERIYAALQTYAEQAEHSSGYQRRLFADDTARGFAFIDLCRKRYDVVLMNPPFGNPPDSVAWLIPADAANNIYPAFVLRGAQMSDGFVGAITDRTFVVQQSFGKYRIRLTSDLGLIALADLGWGVLDDADVQVATYVVRKGSEELHLFVALNANGEEPAEQLYKVIRDSAWTALSSNVIHKLPSNAFAYMLPVAYLGHLKSQDALRDLAVLPRGLGSNDATRTYKAWYEVPEPGIGEGRRYRSLSNGGGCSPFFRDDAGTAEWLRSDGKLLIKEGYSDTNKAYDQKGYSNYFSAGLSFPKQASAFNVAALSVDAIPTREGKGIIPKTAVDRLPLPAYLNSAYARFFVEATNGLHKQSGPVGMTPVPTFSEEARVELSSLAFRAWHLIAQTYTFDEASRLFVSPNEWQSNIEIDAVEVATLRDRIDQIVFDAVGVDSQDRFLIAKSGRPEFAPFCSSPADTFSHALGAAFGRWDVRFGTGEKLVPELPDPFAPLPVCPPGQLQNEQGLPITKEDVIRLKKEGRWHYPHEIPWDGILVDDPGHPLDLDARVHQVLQVIWTDRWEAIEREACEMLGVRILRDYFYKPAGFFADHLKRYSKSRRQAPIYWPLQTPSGSYTLWLYYHRLNDQTLYTCVNDFIEKSKLRDVTEQLHVLRTKTSRNKQEEKDLERLVDLEQELKDFRDELLRVAKFWKPNLNDGVQITAAPLWKLFQHKAWQKTLKETWDRLEHGAYDWAHLAYSIWPDRVREKCKHDKSLAIAHGLEDLYEAPPAQARKKRGRTRG